LGVSARVRLDFHPAFSHSSLRLHHRFHPRLCFPLPVTMLHEVFDQTKFAHKYCATLTSILDSSLSPTFHRAHSVRSYRSSVTVVWHHMQVFVPEVGPLPFGRRLVICLLPCYEDV